MSDHKPHQFRPALYHEEPSRAEQSAEPETGDAAGRDKQGWDAYRKWLKTVNKRPESRRAPIDHSVYSWKGYHSWADRVRQSWKPEEN